MNPNMHAIFVSDTFGLIPVFNVVPVARLSAQGTMQGVILVSCEIYSAKLTGAPLGRGQALCTTEDLPVYNESLGARIAFGRALTDMQHQGLLCTDEVKEIKKVLERAIGATHARV